MLRPLLIVIALAAGLTACGKSPGKDDKKDAAAAPPKLVIAPEDFLTIRTNALASGPVITGSIQPERKADLRAEVSAVVLQVLKENGDAVRKGDVLIRMDQTTIQDNLRSAEDNARNAAQAGSGTGCAGVGVGGWGLSTVSPERQNYRPGQFE